METTLSSWLTIRLADADVWHWLTSAGSSFVLIAAAEIGDKSQLVCMTLAARYRAWPVLLGAVLAFALLNLLAVTFGAVLAAWVPERIVTAAVAVLFGAFGLHALLANQAEEENIQVARSGHGVFVSTFLLIVMAEFGDKTQLAVAAFSSAAPPAPVWLGATLALLFTSALGVWAGRTVLQRLPMAVLHRVSGTAFLTLALYAAYRTAPLQWLMEVLPRISFFEHLY
ncbi:MAG: TMEM165/GDT1 family protein [Methylococcaceae bacterium]|nr:MAG: TMEM165/GDT1 family protein [Methylococcaceae bacterium]